MAAALRLQALTDAKYAGVSDHLREGMLQAHLQLAEMVSAVCL